MEIITARKYGVKMAKILDTNSSLSSEALADEDKGKSESDSEKEISTLIEFLITEFPGELNKDCCLRPVNCAIRLLNQLKTIKSAIVWVKNLESN